ncbi:MraY family glycosyltransferase [Flavobacterium succinicans]|uniref:Putative undecaprenyl-phosphate N-acetylglucosaminyl 1-phosphate transferase n=1 Tax=Flavobacterium succinicans TaxID=29536 RepID=A0A199XP95_9FLAO|nr:glycosyltransferase family 4 protein [Flavobacterium succinicans]OAZ03081.1 putative undecaprenyl-phosphate N-acetylglucosaminyl 1-phosphate transferase [Flavobacterium succinicans]
MIYIVFFIVLLMAELFYFKIADRFNIIDKPNLRSSHTQITLRGGGILFPIAVVLGFGMGYVSWSLTLAVSLVAVVSFVDDIRPLSQLPRLVAHVLAIGLVLYDLDLVVLGWWWLPVVAILLIGWTNAFNFMDGINGITVLYALVSLVSFRFLPEMVDDVPMLDLMGIACLVFAFFNLRKRAKTFAGDVGSVAMALFLGYYMVKLIVATQQVGYLLFFAVYGIDAVLTIFNRLRKRENILEAHRSHLYQYLANEKRLPHVAVAVGYAVVQLAVNYSAIYLIQQQALSLTVFMLILIVMSGVYLSMRYWATRGV